MIGENAMKDKELICIGRGVNINFKAVKFHIECYSFF